MAYIFLCDRRRHFRVRCQLTTISYFPLSLPMPGAIRDAESDSHCNARKRSENWTNWLKENDLTTLCHRTVQRLMFRATECRFLYSGSSTKAKYVRAGCKYVCEGNCKRDTCYTMYARCIWLYDWKLHVKRNTVAPFVRQQKSAKLNWLTQFSCCKLKLLGMRARTYSTPTRTVELVN